MVGRMLGTGCVLHAYYMPMGIGRGDRHKRSGLHAWKGSKAPETHQIWGQSGCWNAKISAEQWGAAMEVEVAIHVHGVSPLPMGIPSKDRCEGAGLKTKKGSLAPKTLRF